MSCGLYSKTTTPVHLQVRCDGCNISPIKGQRWKCEQCPNFDFCDSCHSKNTHFPNRNHKFRNVDISTYDRNRQKVNISKI